MKDTIICYGENFDGYTGDPGFDWEVTRYVKVENPSHTPILEYTREHEICTACLSSLANIATPQHSDYLAYFQFPSC